MAVKKTPKDSKTIFVSGIVEDLQVAEDVSKLNTKRKLNKKTGFFKASDSIKSVSSFLQKKRSQNVLDKLTGLKLSGLNFKNLKYLGIMEKLIRGDLGILKKLLPDQYQKLFAQLEKAYNISSRLFETKSGPRRYNINQVDKRNKADSLAVEIKTHTKSYQNDKAAGISRQRDKRTEAEIYGDVIRDYAELDDPIEILDLIDSIVDPVLKREVSIVAIGSLIDNSHVDVADILIDRVGVLAVTSRYPDIILRLLKNYAIKNEDVFKAHELLATKLVTLLEKININWYLIFRGSSLVHNLRIYQFFSYDARTIIMAYKLPMPANITEEMWISQDYGNPHIASAIMAQDIRYESIESLLSKDWPQVPFSFIR